MISAILRGSTASHPGCAGKAKWSRAGRRAGLAYRGRLDPRALEGGREGAREGLELRRGGEALRLGAREGLELRGGGDERRLGVGDELRRGGGEALLFFAGGRLAGRD